jgi:5-methyltetrahydrofolate--homocysteine methyltransferase
MGKVLETVRKKGILVSDGAWGTLLHQKGLSASECPESWNLLRPDDVLAVAESYVDAGADVILTNSFGGNPFKLGPYGYGDQVYPINRAAGEISRKAAGKKVLVLGSMGPTGKMVFMGEIPGEELIAGFELQSRGLADGGVDGLLVETMSDTAEAALAVQAAKRFPGVDVICTFTLEKNRDGKYRTLMGHSVRDCAEAALSAGADMIGTNCGNGTAGMIEIVREIREIDSQIPVVVHANAGLPVYREGKTHFPEGPEEMASMIGRLADAGANIIGGCCGTTPDHIKLISKRLKSRNDNRAGVK